MSAQVIDFASAAMHRASRLRSLAPSGSRGRAQLDHEFMFWTGASGTRYVHTVYALLECPELPASNIVLVRRHTTGRCAALHIGRVENEAASLNLAEVRQLAATLGANEVHVHLLADTSAQRGFIEIDLSAADDQAAASQAASR